MKVLIVGDNPNVRGGVCNYTRPLFKALSSRGIEVSYLYSASRLQADYRFFSRPSIKRDYTYKNLFKIVNSENLDLNYDNIHLDTKSNTNDYLFKIFLRRHKPDIVHINEMIGFSSAIIDLCNELRIKVVVTVHEYWWLCPKRVMVDFNKRVCEGPSDLKKCSYCILKVQEGYSSRKRKWSYTANRLVQRFKLLPFKKAFQALVKYKNRRIIDTPVLDLAFGNEKPTICERNMRLLEYRLAENVRRLNSCSRVICVSNDVKKHLVKYGVTESQLFVNHIGSSVAERDIPHLKKIDRNSIGFGFIGGVSYYKGVHQLVEAYKLLPKEKQKKAQLHIFGSGSPDYIRSLSKLAEKEINEHKIFLYGRFEHSQLPSITNMFDISVLPSLCADTAPQTIFESFSAGLPVIAPSIGGFSDFVQDGVNGLIFEGTSVKALSEKLDFVIDNPDVIEVFAKNVFQPKKMDDHISEVQKIYSEVLRLR